MKTAREIIDVARLLDIGDHLRDLISEEALSAEDDGEDPSERVFNALAEEIRCAQRAQEMCK